MRLHHAGLSVPDLDRSLDWYCGALGLRPGFRFEIPAIGLRGAFALGEGGSGVELLEQSGAVPGPHRTDPPSANAVHGYNHICFQVQDLAEAYDRLVQRGAAPVWAPRDSPEPGVRMAFVTDPDGNLIELIQPVAGRQAGAAGPGLAQAQPRHDTQSPA
jgi:catechol 2,3-dioxygenase-like lactoylglutathione lyase family enzyme